MVIWGSKCTMKVWSMSMRWKRPKYMNSSRWTPNLLSIPSSERESQRNGKGKKSAMIREEPTGKLSRIMMSPCQSHTSEGKSLTTKIRFVTGWRGKRFHQLSSILWTLRTLGRTGLWIARVSDRSIVLIISSKHLSIRNRPIGIALESQLSKIHTSSFQIQLLRMKKLSKRFSTTLKTKKVGASLPGKAWPTRLLEAWTRTMQWSRLRMTQIC